MKNEPKWTNTITNKLITTRHSESIISQLTNALNNPRKMQLIWHNISKELGENFDGKIVKVKYNSILSKYKSELEEVNRSGSGSSRWKYWLIFHSTFPKAIKLKMEGVEDMGVGENFTNKPIVITNNVKCNELSTENNKMVKKSNLKDQFYEKLIKYLDKDDNEYIKKFSFEYEIKELKSRIDNLDGKLVEVNDKLSILIGLMSTSKEK